MNTLFVVTGASGAGKTTLVENIRPQLADTFLVFNFDSIGVPSLEEMISGYGSPERWQQSMTEVWISRIIDNHILEKGVILDGQIRLSYIVEACRKLGFDRYKIVLVDCNDSERKKRLAGRGQHELANEGMMIWADYLRNEAAELNAFVIDNSDLSEGQAAEIFLKRIKTV